MNRTKEKCQCKKYPIWTEYSPLIMGLLVAQIWHLSVEYGKYEFNSWVTGILYSILSLSLMFLIILGGYWFIKKMLK